MPCSKLPMRPFLALFLLALPAVAAFAQSAAPPSKPPVFDVAGIHQNVNPNTPFRMEFTGNGLTAEGVTLLYALEEAYNLYDSQRWSGGPDWLAIRKFNIEARFDPAEYPNITIEQRRAMLQQLFADRFKAVVHHEPKQFPVYALVLAKGGPKFHPTKKDDQQPQSVYGSSCLITHSRPFDLKMTSCTTSDFASILNSSAGRDLSRTILDQTGLSGRYDFALIWSPEDPAMAERFHSDAPPLFSALPQQLGLKLEATQGPLDTIVIDHIEMPSEN
jgi:uncharacterized protein (TIGR03435 family)